MCVYTTCSCISVQYVQYMYMYVGLHRFQGWHYRKTIHPELHCTLYCEIRHKPLVLYSGSVVCDQCSVCIKSVLIAEG